MTAPGGSGLVPNSPLLVEEKLDALGSASASATPSTVAQRDASANLLVNAMSVNADVVATAGGTTTLTVASAPVQIFYGTAVQDVLLPTTGVVAGRTEVTVWQTQTGLISVKASGGTLVRTVQAGAFVTFLPIQNNPTTASQWVVKDPVGITERVNVVTASGAAQTIPDPITGVTMSRITLSANCTLTFPTPVAGKSFTVTLVQDATGSRTVTWPGTVRWPGGTAPTLTTAATKVDRLTFVCDDGSTWSGFIAGLNFS